MINHNLNFEINFNYHFFYFFYSWNVLSFVLNHTYYQIFLAYTLHYLPILSPIKPSLDLILYLLIIKNLNMMIIFSFIFNKKMCLYFYLFSGLISHYFYAILFFNRTYFKSELKNFQNYSLDCDGNVDLYEEVEIFI